MKKRIQNIYLKMKKLGAVNRGRYVESLLNGEKISVVIPTYQKQPWLEKSIDSLKKQTVPFSNFEVILSVNGKNQDYFEKLEEEYMDEPEIRVVYTEKQSPGAARNNGVKYATGKYLFFLDDDDYLSSCLMEELVLSFNEGTTISCGNIFDDVEGKIHKETYIRKTLEQFQNKYVQRYYEISSLLSTVTGKLYLTSFYKEEFSPFHEELLSSEDVIFWCENFKHLQGKIFCLWSEEGYMRRVTGNSASRPNKEKEFDFYIKDRLHICSMMEREFFSIHKTPDYKRFLVNKIKAQYMHSLNYFNALGEEDKTRARTLIYAYKGKLWNKSLFSHREALAFCHNFPPTADPSAYVASKRLDQINERDHTIYQWDVVSKNMNNIRQRDDEFSVFYAQHKFSKHILIEGKAYFNEEAQIAFGKEAFERVEDRQVEVIYSRSMFAGSHYGAYLYKRKYPQVFWYAEFSDPIYKDTRNKEREFTPVNLQGQEVNFWKDIEEKVYEHADKIIFTNDNQREYMLGYTEATDKIGIGEKTEIWNQPIVDHCYTKVIDVEISLDPDKINIGYFGNFYGGRNLKHLERVLENKQVVLHVFTKEKEKIKKDNIKFYDFVPHLSFLNIGSKMDYLVLSDIEFQGEVNPYLPSKYADYLVTGTKIIAFVQKDSALSKVEHPKLYKVYEDQRCDFLGERNE